MHNANNFFNKALLIHIDNPIVDADNSHNEFTELALSANVKIQDVVSLSKKNIFQPIYSLVKVMLILLRENLKILM